jgi:antitoxin component YwqK of YwqJK toxin-antitoxin module
MRTSVLLFVSLLFVFSGCSHTKTEYWPNGNEKSKITLHGKSYEGSAKYWYEDGTIQMECIYHNNLLDGVLTRFYTSGMPCEVQPYANGKLHGTVKTWDITGKIIAISNYTNGIITGRYIEYYPNAVTKVEGQYYKGNYDGIWFYYDEGGNIIGEGRFKNGTGTQKAFYDNGKLKKVTHFQNNRKDGEEVYYKPEGTVDYICRFRGGRLIEKIQK